MNEHIVLKSNCKHLQLYKEHHNLENFLNIFKIKTFTQESI